MIANLLPLEATHSSLDLFEKPPLLVTFDSAFEQKIGPSYSPTGPTLEFEVIGDRNNFIDLQKYAWKSNAVKKTPMEPILLTLLDMMTKVTSLCW